MSEWFGNLASSQINERLLQTVAALVIGFLLSRMVKFLLSLTFRQRADRQKLFVLQKIISYTLFIGVVLVILKIFEVDLKVILGAAGVLSLAIGFAAQNSVGNLISGLFLIFEKPFVVGDFIEVSGLKGEVLSVDLLSMRIRTMDNLLVRVPNESVMKSHVINYSHFPIRRFDLVFTLSFTEDLERVKKIFLEIIENNPHCLDEPEPLFLVQKMGEYFIEVKFGVWGEGRNMLELQSTFCQQIRTAFIKNNIALPLRSVKLERPLEQIEKPATVTIQN